MTEISGVLLKWKERRHLEKPLSVVCHSCLFRCVGHESETQTYTSKPCCHRTATRHSVDAMTERTDSERWWNDFRILPSWQNTLAYFNWFHKENVHDEYSHSFQTDFTLCCASGLTHNYNHKIVLACFMVFGVESFASQWFNWELTGLVVASMSISRVLASLSISSCTRGHCSIQWAHSN